MVELFEQNVRTNDRQSSKGNQLKWENETVWYKADYTGYEGMAEYVISYLLKKSTLCENEYVLYDLEEIKYKSNIYNGVKSRNFLSKGWQIITLERLFKITLGSSLYKMVFNIDNHKERMLFLVNQVERMTNLKEFGKYMNKLFTIDAMFLNEDRHTHNIAVLMNEDGKFAYCPIFDNGAGLLSDTIIDYPINGDVYEMMESAKAKTLSSDFDEQLDISEELYGKNLRFSFTKKDVRELIKNIDIYSQEEKLRVETILYAQMRKYQYLFDEDL